MTTAKKSSSSDGRKSRNGEMLKPSAEKPLSASMDNLTLFPVDSHAKTSAKLGKGWVLPAQDQDFGKKCSESFAKYDPATSLWRTSQFCLDGGLESFSETWPRAGMTVSGIAFRLPPLAPLTDETEFGSLPTPQARDHITKRTSKSWKAKGGVNYCLSNPEIQEKWQTPPLGELADTHDSGCVHGQAQKHTAKGGVNALGQPRASREDVADARCNSTRRIKKSDQNGKAICIFDNGNSLRAYATRCRRFWAVEPGVGRVAHGIANRVDRLKLLGNGQVVQVVQWIGERIIEHSNHG